MIYARYLKRPFDFIVALVALVALSPLLLALALLVRLKLGSPVLFTQPRPGLNERIFTVYKFRTMNNAKDSQGALLPDAQRLTSFGKWLRSTSLDELPELINVLKGDMSLVGPRPLLVDYLSLYTDLERRRHNVRPGVTGLSQISGRNLLGWEERFALDLRYVETINLLGDITILLRTAAKVLKREGISANDSATMEPFQRHSISQ